MKDWLKYLPHVSIWIYLTPWSWQWKPDYWLSNGDYGTWHFEWLFLRVDSISG